ncbi:Hsp20/alpha crystallin family protein [uncultured Methanobrevibacter sp.]|uniref:Hsp20/alpha crystallin family protein n=1 Tax=uncultured Methanobrevibacter sp. TaxID=253161 RepID=UPI0015BE1DA2|nr:Hsp20/alpha crystallin family protein [uncultured Methanobrevibacter sp.]
MSEEDTIEVNSKTEEKINKKIDESQAKVNEAIDNGKQKFDEKIDANKDRINSTIGKGQNIADKVASDLSKGVDEFFVNVRSAQKRINDKVNDYRKSVIESLDIDLIEDSKNYYIKVATCGVSKEDVNIEAGSYEISIKVVFPKFIDEIETGDDAEVLLEEIKQGTCVKTISFANEIKMKEITAVYDNGITIITVPKVEVEKHTVTVE